MVVAVVAEHQIDVDGVARANQIRVGLDPRIVGVGKCGNENDEQYKRKSDHDSFLN
jgi:hypothetical protein